MNQDVWIFAPATIAGALGIWLLLPGEKSRAKVPGAIFAGASAALLAMQIPHVGGPLADAVFLVIAATLLVAAVGTIASRQASRSAIWFTAALVSALALMAICKMQLTILAAVALCAATIPIAFIFAIRKTQSRGLPGVDSPSCEPLVSAALAAAIGGVACAAISRVFDTSDLLQNSPDAARLQNCLTIAVVVCGIGMAGFLSRRDVFVRLLSQEVMLLGPVLILSACNDYCDNKLNAGWLLAIALTAIAQPGIALAGALVAGRRRTTRDDRPTEESSSRIHVLVMAGGLLVLIGLMLT